VELKNEYNTALSGSSENIVLRNFQNSLLEIPFFFIFYNFARLFSKADFQAGVAQSIEHQPSKLRVAGLNPVSRSILKQSLGLLQAGVAQG
jgi:hypothetical protein